MKYIKACGIYVFVHANPSACSFLSIIRMHRKEHWNAVSRQYPIYIISIVNAVTADVFVTQG